MKMVLPDKDYTLSLIFANTDTLDSRRRQLTERFSTKCSTEIVMLTLSATGQTGLGHYTRRQTVPRKNI